jgi:hypothetical protein
VALDPYGFPEETPSTGERWKPPSGLVPLVLLIVAELPSLACCCGTIAFDVLAHTVGEPDSGLKLVAVFLVLMAPAWPAAGVAIVSAGLWAWPRKWWALAGPNWIIGALLGAAAWMVVFGVVFLAYVIQDWG